MRILALMSGSSLDGLDIGVIELKDEQWNIINPKTIPYSQAWIDKLVNSENLPAKQFANLEADYSKLLVSICKEYLSSENDSIDLVSCHGHTVFHNIDKTFSYQLGNGGIMASLLKKKVVCDFRTVDMAKGGQGAPLMSIVDNDLFSDYAANINLGGIANISAFNEGNYAAFDICPCNQVLNFIAQKDGSKMDSDAYLSSNGFLDMELIDLFEKDPFLSLSYPKSLSNQHVKKYYLNYLSTCKVDLSDQAFTFIVFLVHNIVNSLKQLQENSVLSADKKRILISGGGAFHPLIVKQLKIELSSINLELVIPERRVIEFKELLLMGYLGYLRLHKQYNILHNFTGASSDSIAGALYEG